MNKTNCMLTLKVVLLVWYSKTKIIFRVMKLTFGLKIDFKNWKYPIFDCPQSSCITWYQKILWRSSFGCKNLLNFMCHTMKFHNCHHTTWHACSNSRVISGWTRVICSAGKSVKFFTNFPAANSSDREISPSWIPGK